MILPGLVRDKPSRRIPSPERSTKNIPSGRGLVLCRSFFVALLRNSRAVLETSFEKQKMAAPIRE